MKARNIAEFGDFQTPADLAAKACARLMHITPRSIVEPTCGKGSFVLAAAATFRRAESVLGFDINPEHLRAAKEATTNQDDRVAYQQADFFSHDWETVLRPELGPWLVIGNPPWVTSAELGSLSSTNLPVKSNFQAHKGLDAITGKANFDLSEWMLLRALDWLNDQPGAIAVLCKTAVARKVLNQAWTAQRPVSAASIFKIDAALEFGAAVDACLFVLEIGSGKISHECLIYDDLDSSSVSQVLGFDGRHLVSDVGRYERARKFEGEDPKYVWRSGVKHDCTKVMELRRVGNALVNGFDEVVEVESEMTMPLLKSSDVGNGSLTPRGSMIIPQRFIGQETDYIKTEFPATWEYLINHGALLDRRGSSIYQKNPRFSIFGVGAYSFSMWKVAISGFYKKTDFLVVPPENGRAIVFDDTVYFLACSSEAEARFIYRLLSTEQAQDFYHSLVHCDEKRPITVGLLKRLSLRKVAEALGEVQQYERFSGSLAFAKAA